MQKCPKCKSKTLVQDEFGMGMWERHVKCHTCGLLHVRGAATDSIKKQLEPQWWEKEEKKRARQPVKIFSLTSLLVGSKYKHAKKIKHTDAPRHS